MNEPIISPWLFYWASTVNGIIAFCAFGAAISLGVAFCLLRESSSAARDLEWTKTHRTLYAYITEEDADDKEQHEKKCFILEGKIKQNKKNSKKCFIAAVIFMVALIFVPSETTIYRMVAASYATPQNIEYVAEKTGKAIDSSVDYIVDKIIEAGSKWEQRNNGNNN